MGRFHLALSKKAILLIAVFVILLVAVPLTVYIVQQQQQTQSSAAPATVLSFTKSAPTTSTAKIGDTITFDVMAAPGQNIVSQLLVYIQYDAAKLKPDDTTFFTADPSLTNLGYSVYRNPTIVDKDQGIFSVGYTTSVSNIAASTFGIRCPVGQTTCAPVKVGTLKFSAIAAGTAQISYLRTGTNDTFVKTGGTSDTAVENALLNVTPGEITIVADATPTPTPSATATPTPSASPAVGEAPVCSSLDADNVDGTAPLAVTFTANGTDSDGTVDKVSFTYGDGNNEDVSEGGGIGTATVGVQASHTYSDAGTFNASATLTDSDNNISQSCTTTITVASGSAVAEASPSASPLPATGPSKGILGVGILGAIITAIGVLLFLAL